jgi:hypothetical protein
MEIIRHYLRLDVYKIVIIVYIASNKCPQYCSGGKYFLRTESRLLYIIFMIQFLKLS